jgi:transitional endoplasmic reticulum ATPase
MGELQMIWTILSLAARDHDTASPLAKAVVKWAREHKKPLRLDAEIKAKRVSWRGLSAIAKLRAAGAGDAVPELFGLTDLVATAVQLDRFNTQLIRVTAAAERLTLVAGLSRLLMEHNADMLGLFGEVAGAGQREAGRRVRQSELVRLGLARFYTNKAGVAGFESSWTLEKLLDRGPADENAIVEALVGLRQVATLDLDAFAHVRDTTGFICRLISGALREKARGINILLHGPSGTGKTELAKTLAHAAGAQLFSVGEADEDGQEPNRRDRVTAYKLAQRVVDRRSGTVLLFDEMEDLIGAARPSDGDYFTARDGSKVFINRMLETNTAPTIWTTNAIGNVDPAILRRMSFVMKLEYPTPSAGRAMLNRVAADENVAVADDALTRLVEHAPEATTVLRNALRAGRLAEGGDVDAARVASSLVGALRGGRNPHLPAQDARQIDLGLYEAGQDIERLLARLADADTPRDFSLLLTGPPGTGKTALAHHLAYRLERPLIVKRASDLLSKWVGETEQQIADAFTEAVAKNGVLLFDEVDSLLADRSGAQRSWEVTQVNELLTWFDSHPLPFIAATNHGAKLDPAAMRRFVFKLDLKPLSADKAAAAYMQFFGETAPVALKGLNGLTPGDLAVVKRQLRYLPARPASSDIVARLMAELAAKPDGGGRIGF